MQSWGHKSCEISPPETMTSWSTALCGGMPLQGRFPQPEIWVQIARISSDPTRRVQTRVWHLTLFSIKVVLLGLSRLKPAFSLSGLALRPCGTRCLSPHSYIRGGLTRFYSCLSFLLLIPVPAALSAERWTLALPPPPLLFVPCLWHD